jgi:hypothetical protein
MNPAEIAALLRVARTRDAAEQIVATLKGRDLQAVADALRIHLYGSAGNKRRLLVEYVLRRLDSDAITRVGRQR